ncbi:MAG: hypothetical protein HN644_13525 [Rhodospirillales bacterium]|jgi:hypothetical protein|nr:hypothetical protein [Rhodospirillales bacterium]MBT4040191.1 hypothetical protein [Rhodospirillales bacterium]MBT4628559.1 hypothetical protein [Rhodospirillales bacterium]MBT5352687.1 hypothetical protein [Rhodospirillales bacterium]MBT5519923.1 hypothetical protein [Rhodospirillales bacterium]
MNKPIKFLNAQADNATCVWSVATFGAIAEYHSTPEAPASGLRQDKALTLTSDQGGMRVTYHPGMTLVAYEGLSKVPTLWSQGVSLCLPADQAKMAGNAVITERGPDTHAIRSDGQGMRMFDLGIGAPHMDACVRTEDTDLIDLFHRFQGKPLFDGCQELVTALVERSPTRVFSSALARIEVHTPIPTSDSETPHGAHTHILPDLLAHGRTHAATIPIPDGWLPGLNLFPPNPARGTDGNAKGFDLPTHDAFQAIMADFADSGVITIKDRVRTAVLDGRGPETMGKLDSRLRRTALRVALRQIRFTDGASDNLNAWLAAFEPNGIALDE